MVVFYNKLNNVHKKRVFKLWFLVGFLFTTIAIAQNTLYDLSKPSMKEIATSKSEPNWIKFKASEKINPKILF